MTIIGRGKKGFENRLFEIRKRGYTRRSVLLLLYIIYIYIYISHSSHTKTHSLLVLVAPWWDLRLGGIGLNGLLVHSKNHSDSGMFSCGQTEKSAETPVT